MLIYKERLKKMLNLTSTKEKLLSEVTGWILLPSSLEQQTSLSKLASAQELHPDTGDVGLKRPHRTFPGV